MIINNFGYFPDVPSAATVRFMPRYPCEVCYWHIHDHQGWILIFYDPLTFPLASPAGQNLPFFTVYIKFYRAEFMLARGWSFSILDTPLAFSSTMLRPKCHLHIQRCFIIHQADIICWEQSCHIHTVERNMVSCLFKGLNYLSLFKYFFFSFRFLCWIYVYLCCS